MNRKTILGATLLLLAIALPALATPPAPADSLVAPAVAPDLAQAEADAGIEWGFREKLRQRVRVLRILVNVAFSLIESRIGGSEQAGWGG